MNKPRQAKLMSCTEQPDRTWIATDSAGRRFIAPTEKEAVKMLVDYNHRKPS